jgi:predicted molibdopterin-dependent oxidoreductase YjgC
MSRNSARPVSDTPAPRADLRIGAGARGTAIEFTFDGRAVRAFAGESVACALFGAGIRTLRESPRTGSARGMFCLMGSCQECAVWVDGRRVPACQEPARNRIDVKSGSPQGVA